MRNPLLPFAPVNSFPEFCTLENRYIGHAGLPSPHLLEVHRRFTKALSWLEVAEYMGQDPSSRGMGSSLPSQNIANGLKSETFFMASLLLQRSSAKDVEVSRLLVDSMALTSYAQDCPISLANGTAISPSVCLRATCITRTSPLWPYPF